MIRVGIAGANWIAGVHAAAVRSHARIAKLVAVSEIEPERRVSFAERWNVVAYATTDELVSNAKIDALAICLPNWLHASAAVAAAEAGKHVLVEKPMAVSVEECDQMIAAAERAGVTLMVALPRRYYPAVMAGAELIAAGAIGTPMVAEAHYAEPWTAIGRPRWYADRALGGGVWLGTGVHSVDGLAFLLNSEIASVRGIVDRRVHDLDADDFGFAWFELCNGTTATAMVYGYRSGVYRDDITVVGTDGLLRCERDLAFVGKDEQWEAVDVRGRWPELDGDYTRIAFHLEWGAFLDSIIHRTPAPISGTYGRHLVAALIAAEQSTATRGQARLGAGSLSPISRPVLPGLPR